MVLLHWANQRAVFIVFGIVYKYHKVDFLVQIPYLDFEG